MRAVACLALPFASWVSQGESWHALCGFVDLHIRNKKYFTFSDKHLVLSTWKSSVVL